MDPIRLEDEHGNLLSSTTVVKGKRSFLPSIESIAQSALDAENARGPYGQATPGMVVTPDTRVRKQLTLEDIKNAVIDNPAKTALALGGTGAAIFGAPLTIPTAAVLGMVAEGVDKSRPFSENRESDYSLKTPAENSVDIASAGAWSVIGDVGLRAATGGAARFSRIADDALERANRVNRIGRGYAEPESEMLGGFVAPTGKYEMQHMGYPSIDASRFGGFEGYPVMDYSRMPGASQIEYALEMEGKPRFVPASSLPHAGMENLDDKMVGNPAYMSDPRTPEGKIFAERMAARDPKLNKFGNAFSASSSADPFDPLVVVPPTSFPGKLGAARIGNDYYDTKFSFLSDPRGKMQYKGYNQSLGYAYPMSSDRAKELIFDRIASGAISERNLPAGFASVQDLTDRLVRIKNVFSKQDVALTDLGRSLPENSPMVQEFIPLHSNVKIYDKKNQPWYTPDAEDPELHSLLNGPSGSWMYQKAQFNKAQPLNEAVIYKNSVDIGGAYRQGKSLKPGDVLASFDPRKMKYPANYGFWNTNDIRPLAAIPLATLGALGLSGANSRQ